MPLPQLVLNPNARVSAQTVGQSGSPVVVVDDVFANARDVARFGREEAAFTAPRVVAYPGLNAEVPEGFAAPLVTALRPVLARGFGVPSEARLAGFGYFGLVTLRPEQLDAIQAVPHVDYVGPRCLAALIYLCDEACGGTAFFRHRETGFERLTAENIGAYNAARASEAEAGQQAYITGDDSLFERIGGVEARFNRLVVYNGNLLHSGQVNPERLSPDPKLGRLTLNFFVADPSQM